DRLREGEVRHDTLVRSRTRGEQPSRKALCNGHDAPRFFREVFPRKEKGFTQSSLLLLLNPPCPVENSRLEGDNGRKARSHPDLPPSAWRYRVESRGKVPRPG